MFADYGRSSPNHLIRSHQHVRRNCKADLLGGFEIDYQLEFCWLLDGKVGWLCAFQDFVYIGCCPAKVIADVGSVGEEATVLCPTRSKAYRWQLMLRSEVINSSSKSHQKAGCRNEESFDAVSFCGLKCALNLIGSMNLKHIELQAHRLTCEFQFFDIDGNSSENGDTSYFRNSFLEHLQLFSA